MNFFEELVTNKLFFATTLSWLLAQIVKTLLNLFATKKFTSERLYGSGGMPSSHSSGVTTLSVCSGIMYGFGSFQFAISALLAIIVIYDARGVRREAGRHAKLLNEIMENFGEEFKTKVGREKKLNELIGHSGLQIFAGVLLGLAFALVLYWTGFIQRI